MCICFSVNVVWVIEIVVIVRSVIVTHALLTNIVEKDKVGNCYSSL